MATTAKYQVEIALTPDARIVLIACLVANLAWDHDRNEQTMYLLPQLRKGNKITIETAALWSLPYFVRKFRLGSISQYLGLTSAEYDAVEALFQSAAS
jgi:hypothetical protein